MLVDEGAVKNEIERLRNFVKEEKLKIETSKEVKKAVETVNEQEKKLRDEDKKRIEDEARKLKEAEANAKKQAAQQKQVDQGKKEAQTITDKAK